jgi:RNA recognition motif-containing protein
MSNRVFVGNLNYAITEDTLKELFATVRTVVSARIVTDQRSGRSKGFGFVEYETPEIAQKAVETLKGKEVEGRAMIVDIAKPAPEGGRGGGGGRPGGRGGFGGGRGRGGSCEPRCDDAVLVGGGGSLERRLGGGGSCDTRCDDAVLVGGGGS